MEQNPGYALITTDEYKELIETYFYQEELIHENEKLKKQVKDLQIQLLESNIVDSRLRNGKMEEVTDIKDYYFPYNEDFIKNSDIPLKNIIEFIKTKKEQFDKEKEENHE